MAKNNNGMLLIVGAAAAAAFALSRKKDKEKKPAPSPEGLTPRPDSLPKPPGHEEEPAPEPAPDEAPKTQDDEKDPIDLPMPSFSTDAPATKTFTPGKETAEQIKSRCESFLDQMLDENGNLLELASDTAYEAMMHAAADLLEQGEYPLEDNPHGEALVIAALDELIPGCDWKMMDTGVGPLMVFGPANTIDQRVQYMAADIDGMTGEVIGVMNAFHEGDEKAEMAAAEYGIEKVD
jgi:hypothetical protein